jgi:hypothetical protein
MPLPIIGPILGIVDNIVQAPERAAQRRAEAERIAHEARMAQLQAERAAATQRTLLIGLTVVAAGGVAIFMFKD